jgi:hypothetical protein
MTLYSTFVRKILSSFLIVSMALTPAFAFAKDHGNGNGRGEENDQGENDHNSLGDATSCLTSAFGHLIAPGWIKHNGQLSEGEDCSLPPGIGGMFGRGGNGEGDHGHGTTTPPVATTTPPAISAIVTVPGSTSIQINWMTNEFASSKVYYSSTSTIDVTASTTAFVSNSSLNKSHSVAITGLDASSAYYFIVESTNMFGQTTDSAVFSASTTAPAADTTPPVISNALAVIGSSTVQLSWTTDEPATTKAYYSISTPVDVTASTTPFSENATLVTSHLLTVSGLATSTMYHMIIESKDASGNAARSGEFPFTTGM